MGTTLQQRLESIKDSVRQAEIQYSVAKQQEENSISTIRKMLEDKSFCETLSKVFGYTQADVDNMMDECSKREYQKIEERLKYMNLVLEKKVSDIESAYRDNG